MDGKNKKAPWLSVIIPIYNAEKYLDKCIKSILRQSFTDFELLLIDDGSTDHSAEICLRYAEKDSRVQYHRKENGGSYQARLYGAELAHGSYITFCDSDDYYANNKVFEFLCQKVKTNNCEVVQFGYYKKYNHFKKAIKFSKKEKNVYSDDIKKYEYPKLLCSFWDFSYLSCNVFNKLYKKDLFIATQNSKTAPRLFWGDDLVMNLHLFEHCKSILFLTEPLYMYRQSSGGTKRFSKTTMRDLNTIKEMQLSFLERYEYEKSDIEYILFQEIAKWFFIYVCQGFKVLPESELRQLISESLALPTFKLCTEFYKARPTDTREPIRLIANADADEYISHAKAFKEPKQNPVKKLIKELYKRI